MRNPRLIAVLGGLALASVAAVAVDVVVAPARLVPPARIFDRVELDDIRSITWARAGEQVSAVRGDDGAFHVRGARTGIARRAALIAFAGALDVAEPERVSSGPAGSGTDIVVERVARPPLHFTVEKSAPDATSSVLATRGHRYTLPGYLARELDVSEDDVLSRRPLPALADGDPDGLRVVVGGISATITGPPWRATLADGSSYFADPQQVSALVDRLRALRFEPSPVASRAAGRAAVEGDPAGIEIAVRTAARWTWFRSRGPCPGGAAVRTEAGAEGCVAAADLAALATAVAGPRPLIDRHLVVPGRQGQVDSFVIARGDSRMEVKHAEGQWRAGDTELDEKRVLDWLRRFDGLINGEPEPLASPSRDRSAIGPSAEVDLTTGDGATVVIRLFEDERGTWLARGDEALAWPVAGDRSAAIVDPDPRALLPLTVVARDSALVLALTVTRGHRRLRISRGELIGEWRSADSAALDLAAINRLVAAASHLDAEAVLPATARPGAAEAVIDLAYQDPMGGRPAHVVLELTPSPGTAGTCRVQLASRTYRVGPSACSALLAPLATPR